MAAFDDALFLWDPAIGNSKSHDLVDDVDPSNSTDGDTGSDGDGDFRLYDSVSKFARFSERVSGTSIDGPGTYMAAVKIGTAGSVNWIFGHCNTGNNNAYELFDTQPGPGNWNFQSREGGINSVTGGAATADAFVVLVGTTTRPGTTELELWVDGTSQGTISLGATPPVDVLTVGILDRPSALGSADLQVYAAAYWDRVLSSSEIAEITSDPQAYLSSGAVSGTLAETEEADTLAASGTVTAPTTSGTLAETEADDTLSAAGTFTPPTVSGTVAITEADDAATASGTFTPDTISGTLAETEEDDSLSASGTATAPTFSGSLAEVEADDTLAASGTFSFTVFGTVAITEEDDTLAAVGTIPVARERTVALETSARSMSMSASQRTVTLKASRKEMKIE